MQIRRDLARIGAILRKRRWERAVATLPAAEFVRFFRRWNRDWPIEVSLRADSGLIAVRDKAPPHTEILIARPSRLILYQHGVEARLQWLWHEYLVNQLCIEQGDIVIDVGANVGEFSIMALRKGAQTISIEPDPAEFGALQANLAQGRKLNLALWNERRSMTFYSKNESGDSSLIEIAGYSQTVTVEAHRLDDLVEQEAISHTIKLIKLEAEGAEPEIIAGGKRTLRRTRFVAVDTGPERGLEQENTVVPVTNALIDLGFRLRRFGNQRFVQLFENTAMDGS